MVALDTNVLIRFLTADDPAQHQTAVTLFATEQIFIADTVLLETGWVLRYTYQYEPAQINEAIRKLCGLPNVHLTDAERVQLALAGVEAGLAWADAFHWVQATHCTQLLTFDKQLAQRAERLAGLPVVLLGADK